MDKIIKFNSVQGGPFTANQNLVDFHIPVEADDVYDLSKSYLNVITEIVSVGDNPFNVYNAFVGIEDDAGSYEITSPYNSFLVKNFNMTCSNYGRLSDVRRSDLLSQTLNDYLLTEEEKKSGEYSSINNGSNHKYLYSSPWREMRSEGTVLSKNIDHGIKVPLSQLDGIGDVTDVCGKLGNLDFHFELNLDKLTTFTYQGEETRADEFGQEANTVFNNYAPGAVQDWTTLTTTALFYSLDDSPYFVGQQLSLTAVSVGTGAPAIADVPFEITGIEWLRTTAGTDIAGALKLTVQGLPALTNADNTFNTITCDGVDPDTLDIIYNKVELVLVKKHPDTVEKCDGMTWNRWSTEQDNGNGLTSFSKQYVVEPNANTLFVLFPDEGKLPSHNNAITDVLMRVDNVDLTNRIVKTKSPLYYDRLNMSLMNIGKQLKSLVEVNYNIANVSTSEAYSIPTNNTVVFANPLPITESSKLLQLNVNSTVGGLNKINLYKLSQHEILFK